MTSDTQREIEIDRLREALKEARQFILAPAEDLLWGVVHRIDAALAPSAPIGHPEVVGVAWGDSGPIPGQSFGDEFDAQPQPVAPVAVSVKGDLIERLRTLAEGKTLPDWNIFSILAEAAAALSSIIPATKGGDAAPPRRETQEYLLRAMGTNYSAGNLWDHLDKDVVLKAADEIKALRAALNDRIQPLAAALSAQDTDGVAK